ncbi:hypothetical protein BO221_32235 [Archangium sp. Cb G35]|uniref:hypothetical protein n=1 Tax=Archangium sp. Cb G35 TaxID=1920190 RepID=UPI000936D9E2|nr:hypothetical protein [Archangium sp. Cb G35]OJT20650.1 hypothetical protein BO221_32235 [Archangium sp. Cb G35]
MKARATREEPVITDGPVQRGQILPRLLTAFLESTLMPGLDLEEYQAGDIGNIRAYQDLIRKQE